ncbi:hypothetical protein EYF80_021127 [Liparis tanakae]|uniref:Uncharacterized protein n=1 Tax=Liparis tanakae TaxID=230148 RepID=A0A4Z2HUH3_9TELE|nr:hypothetical protein EYF80_021127 [Liparis tanakae]
MAFSQAMTVPDMHSMMSHGLMGKANGAVDNSRLPLCSGESAFIHWRASPATGAPKEPFTASDSFIISMLSSFCPVDFQSGLGRRCSDALCFHTSCGRELSPDSVRSLIGVERWDTEPSSSRSSSESSSDVLLMASSLGGGGALAAVFLWSSVSSLLLLLLHISTNGHND